MQYPRNPRPLDRHQSAPVIQPVKMGLGGCGKDTAKRNGERGAGALKAIIWTIILASFIYVTVKMVPPLINEYELTDGMQTIARYASMSNQTPETIRASVLKEAEKDNLPISAEDIKVEDVRGNIKIDVEYSVTVDLSVYQWTLNFHPVVSNAALL
jgi:hypothetical protein